MMKILYGFAVLLIAAIVWTGSLRFSAADSGRHPKPASIHIKEGEKRLSRQRQAAVLLKVDHVTRGMGFARTTTDRILLPIEVLGAEGTTVSRTITLQDGQAESVRSLWLQIHGLRYADQASVQVNTSAWIPLNNTRVCKRCELPVQIAAVIA